MHVPVWLYFRVYELVDKYIRHESHFGAELYEKLTPAALKLLRRGSDIRNNDHYAFFHEEAVVEFPKLRSEEWQKIHDIINKNIKDIEKKIILSNDELENDLMQFELLELQEFLNKINVKFIHQQA